MCAFQPKLWYLYCKNARQRIELEHRYVSDSNKLTPCIISACALQLWLTILRGELPQAISKFHVDNNLSPYTVA